MSKLVTLLLLLTFPAAVSAKDYFMTPEGAGDGDGRDWDHALKPAKIGEIVNQTLQPGDSLHLGGGVYRDVRLTISEGGEEQRPKRILGVDRGQGLPVFESTWSEDKPSKGATAIRIEPGVSQVIFQGLRLRRYMTGVRISAAGDGGAASSNVVFEDVDVDYVRHGFYVSDADDLRLEACDLKRYTKHAFRFEEGCDRVTVRDCVADCSEGDADWETKTELLPFGFFVNNGGAPNTAFVFENCLAANNLMPLQKGRYKNGDGFVVEGNTADVKFVRCRAIRNQDAGFDLKVPGVQLIDCVALRNSRNFRIWTGGSLENCFAGWAGTGLWSNGPAVTANRCTFHALKVAAMTDDRAKGPITLTDCLISNTAQKFRRTASGGRADFEATELTEEPNFVRPAEDWDGIGEAMNSQAFPEKGYRATGGEGS